MREVIFLKKELRGGYTTGACMAAGVKAALHYLVEGDKLNSLILTALDGTPLTIPIKSIKPLGDPSTDGVRVEIIKESGDDPDITNGASVFTVTKLKPDQSGVTFSAGEGIGHVTKPGLQIPVGEPAINLGPRKLVQTVVDELLGPSAGVEVEVSIPAGTELAERTLNPILGVVGGISVIGSTGVLRPMSEEGFKNSLVPQIDVAMAMGYEAIVFVPGKIGETQAVKHGINEQVIVQTSNFIGFMLEAAEQRGVKELLLFGHIGKLAKVAAGGFHTHNRVGDARLETMAAYAALYGLPPEGVRRVLESITTEEAMTVISEYRLEKVYEVIAQRASERAMRFVFGNIKIGTVLVTLKGEILGMDENARAIGRKLGWDIDNA